MEIILKNLKTSHMNWKVKRFTFSAFAILVSVTLSQHAVAQTPAVENSVFWEVTGKGLTQPSYLFGTFHLMGKKYVDSLTNVTAKFQQSQTMVGEMVVDSTMTMKMMMAAQLKGTTLDKLLTPELYAKTGTWLKEVSGYDIKLFNGMNPMTVQIVLMRSVQQKFYPMNPVEDPPMDLYFQQHAKKARKKVLGLETLDVQIAALYEQFSYERQAEMLAEFVNDQDKAYQEMITMNKYYRMGNLGELEKLMSTQTFEPGEVEKLLDDRNKAWVKQLPSLFSEQSTFVAVGALHLSGKNGLVNLLRQQGYTVKSVPLK
jgi:uncharacterized protein YbaP (TraB family)